MIGDSLRVGGVDSVIGTGTGGFSAILIGTLSALDACVVDAWIWVLSKSGAVTD